MIDNSSLLNLLEKYNIEYKISNHEALFSVNDVKKQEGLKDGANTKNLFLKNKKNKFFLISCLQDASINLKKLGLTNNMGNLSFANEEYLIRMLNVKPGAVTPFGLLNDINNLIDFYLDNKITKFKNVNFHPMINTSTLNLKTNDFLNFMSVNNKVVKIINFDTYAILNEPN